LIEINLKKCKISIYKLKILLYNINVSQTWSQFGAISVFMVKWGRTAGDLSQAVYLQKKYKKVIKKYLQINNFDV
jgi:hypothetical protein